MNPFHRSLARNCFLPCLVLVCTSPIWRPTLIEAQGCSSCAASSGAYQGGRAGLARAFPTLNRQLGGSDEPSRIRLTHTGVQTVEITYEGSRTTLKGNETKYVTGNRGGETQPLPGEPISYISDTTENPGSAPPGSTEAQGHPTCEGDTGGVIPNKVVIIPDPVLTGLATSPAMEGTARGGNGAMASGDPPTPSAPGDPAADSPAMDDHYEKHGTALQTGPGAVEPILNDDDELTGGADLPPPIMFAVALGKSDDGNGTAGYLVPNPSRDRIGGATTPQIGPEKLGYYHARGVDGAVFYNGFSPSPGDPVTDDYRWVAGDGLTIVTQETSEKLRFDVYSAPYLISSAQEDHLDIDMDEDYLEIFRDYEDVDGDSDFDEDVYANAKGVTAKSCCIIC